MVARSEEIDSWIESKDSNPSKSKDSDLLGNFARARKLTEEFLLAKQELQERMAVLRKQLQNCVPKDGALCRQPS